MEGFKPYTGGEELRRAIAALAGPTIAQEQEVRPSNVSGSWALTQPLTTLNLSPKEAYASYLPAFGHHPITQYRPSKHRAHCLQESRVPSGSAGEPGSAPQPQMIPISVKSADHSTRELAFAAQRYAKAAQRNSADFEAIYNHGLALQELASRVTSSRDEQTRLLQQVIFSFSPMWCHIDTPSAWFVSAQYRFHAAVMLLYLVSGKRFWRRHASDMRLHGSCGNRHIARCTTGESRCLTCRAR